MLSVKGQAADPNRLWVCDALPDGTVGRERAMLAPQAVQQRDDALSPQDDHGEDGHLGAHGEADGAGLEGAQDAEIVRILRIPQALPL
jgi:hypothetical protein